MYIYNIITCVYIYNSCNFLLAIDGEERAGD